MLTPLSAEAILDDPVDKVAAEVSPSISESLREELADITRAIREASDPSQLATLFKTEA